ncbi:MAG: serine--tRNA ligase [Bacteroidia bacterium]
MIELQRLRTHVTYYKEALAKKHPDIASQVEEVLHQDQKTRALIQEIESLRRQLNQISKEIAHAKSEPHALQILHQKSSTLKHELAHKESLLDQEEKKLQELLLRLPNAPHESVPPGQSADQNVIIHQGPLPPHTDENRLPHWEIAQQKGLIDFARGSKVTGSGFPFYVGKGAKLQRALINFFLDQVTQAGYLEIEPPILVNPQTAFGTAQLPDKDAQMYYVEKDDLYLIPTAEVPLTNFYRDEILSEKQLPVKICGYTPCFRREAGSYGKEVRGLNRLHQFDKVEIVQITHPHISYQALEEMRLLVQSLVEKLELAYRVVLLCGGDMSFAAAKTYDVEVWSPAQKKWLEVSSISNFETFQSYRMKIRIKDGKKNILAHTLNGSALALPRIVAALLETHQTPDGKIRIPKALQPYTEFEML